MRVMVDLIGPEGARATALEMLRMGFGHDVTVDHDPHGAPLLRGEATDGWNVTVSHSRHWAAVGLTRGIRAGIDLEEPRPLQLLRVSPRFMSHNDLEAFGPDRLAAWTCKEAVYKAAATPGLALLDIALTAPDEATLPDGRRFSLQVRRLPEFTLTTALPITCD